MVDRTGQQLGNYRLLRLLGQGGFAQVYLGEHIHLTTFAAIKVLQEHLTGEELEKFRGEARLIAHLDHPHIVRVLEFGVEAQTPFLVMSYAPNGSLRERHPRGLAIPPHIMLSYARQVADALQYAHDQRIIHRDVKPENMLVDRANNVLLSDFGIAMMSQSSQYQQTQDVTGTVAYMAPEQLQGKPRPASDQYALAAVVYEWISGRPPFRGSFTEVASQHLFSSPPPLRFSTQGIAPGVESVVLKALAKDPQQRFVSARAFADALQQACSPASVTSSPLPQGAASPQAPVSSGCSSKLLQPAPTLTPTTAPPTQQHPVRRWLPWIVLAGMMVLVLLGVLLFSSLSGALQSRIQHASTATSGAQVSNTPQPTVTTPAHVNVVHIYDQSQVLDVARVQGEAEQLTYPVDIYTINTWTGSNDAFDKEARAKLGNNTELIIIAIDTVHHHLAIVSGARVPLSSSQLQSAVNAFIESYQNGDYSGATIAALHSLKSSLGQAFTGWLLSSEAFRGAIFSSSLALGKHGGMESPPGEQDTTPSFGAAAGEYAGQGRAGASVPHGILDTTERRNLSAPRRRTSVRAYAGC